MKKINVKTVMISLMFSMFLTGCAIGENNSSGTGQGEDTKQEGTTNEDGLMAALNACVKVDAPGTYGSGVIYEEQEDSLWIITAAHVVETAGDAAGIQVIFSEEVQVACENYLLVPEADLAFLQIAKDMLPESFNEYIVVQKNREIFDALQSSEGVFLEDKYGENEFGFRFATVVENWIYVEDFAQHMILLLGEADAGMSGGGVFTEDGCFLGIICGGNEMGELAVLPYSVIETNLSKVYQ